MRVNKYLSVHGFCSRRQADKLIEEGRIRINDTLASMGDQVGDTDKVYVDNHLVKEKKSDVYLMLNKPRGVVSTTDLDTPNNLVSFLNYPSRIFNVGRLDKDSEGLLILTSNGDIVNKILRSEFNHEKEYVVKVNKSITPDFVENMESGVPILDRITKPCTIRVQNDDTFSIILTEGMNRQIRRMCDYFGYRVTSLRRIRLMHLILDVPPGSYRPLTDKELKELFKTIGMDNQ